MYISFLKINNFRKFGENDNVIGFVKSHSESPQKDLVASSTTLVIGKNNSGKTTVTKALELIHSDSEKITGHDFNYSYSKNILKENLNGKPHITPKLSFEIEIILDDMAHDLIGDFQPFIDAKKALQEGERKANITIEYEVKIIADYISKIEELKTAYSIDEYNSEAIFRKYLDILSKTQFRRKIKNYQNINVDTLTPKNIIDLRVISAAKNIHDKRLLTKSFNKIIKYMYESDDIEYKGILSLVDNNNQSLTQNIKTKHQLGVERILAKIIADKDIGIELRSELTFDKLMSDLITYEHKDGEFLVPESQFGLGYASLVSIIGEIIDYTNQSLKETSQSRIRLLCIEEPEVFMHPQMQINFIRHIQEALNEILSSHLEHLNSLKSQILITTHSSHILNSVIHSSNTFDDINYICLKDGNAANVLLKDKEIANTQEKSLQFEFIKKHIKHQTPDLFFSDAIIFVEGITEERVLNSYIEDHPVLNRMNISVFRIDGAHAKVYAKLINKIQIPSLIITDIDFKKETKKTNTVEATGEIDSAVESDVSDGIIEQISTLSEDLITTNATLCHFFADKRISSIKDYYVNDNLMVVFQKDCVGVPKDCPNIFYYATSFEEALILKNYDNTLLLEILLKIIKTETLKVLGDPTDVCNIAHKSRKIQKLLARKKSDFSNSLIFSLVTTDQPKPELPDYILKGLEWLTLMLKRDGVSYEL
ncbi:ATP-dependent nuclease [Klebsiella sp. 2HUBk12mer]|uniref:ATP-dependent nuclease n=1 Tax=Klebsiella sp. 2HUBk12mer TaxID=3391022 RepID=UPI003983A314